MSQRNEDVPDMATPQLAKGWLRWLWGAVACLFILVGIIGAILPGLPSAVFIVVGAWAASKSSERMHQWIEDHRLFGHLLRTWRSGYISRRTKLLATLTMALSMALAIHHIANLYLLFFAIGGMGCGLFWIWSRPEPAEQ
ncbi:YbaN family protein [Microbulbifer sp. THAF38]|uniref:YbaN family protein n=1 Tax=Microbulbifer sp. THAF38 TaxID=2587856 RepID=UPI0012698134|nr:YbaN family protein [Microbulbifer sp. THAF38]QFT54880.1 Inner membrane protein YbaN [Microbulbifer sp. THAF38]